MVPQMGNEGTIANSSEDERRIMTTVIQKNVMRKVSSALFGLILLCFFLPFINVTCNRMKVTSVTGFQMVTGATVKQQKGKAEPLAILVFVSAIAGLGLSFFKGRNATIAVVTAAAVGLILMLLLKFKIDSYALRAVKEGRGMVGVEYNIAFWGSVLLFLAAAGLSGFVFFQNWGRKNALDD